MPFFKIFNICIYFAHHLLNLENLKLLILRSSPYKGGDLEIVVIY